MHSGALSVALVFNLGESLAALVDCLLVLLSQILLLSEAYSQVLLFALKLLVGRGDCSDLGIVLDDALVSSGNLLLNCHGLL